jgi:glyoxylase-like metal-dependent hydrolase (beta-lactamase superfamily II)
MLISGGVSGIVPDVLWQFDKFCIDENRIKKLLILHAHFDHVGIVPFFKRRNPDMEIYASGRAWERLTSKKTIVTINAFSASTNLAMGNMDDLSRYDLEWKDDICGISVAEGDKIDLGDAEITILETPGHSSCSISAYNAKMKALFSSDSGGIPYKNEHIPAGNSNYTQYQESLEKLRVLDVDYLCADHCGYVTGADAREFVQNTIQTAKDFRRLMESVYRRTNSIDRAVQHLVAMAAASRPDYFLPREILEKVYTQMVRHIAGHIQGTGVGQ